MTAPAYFRLGGFVLADPEVLADPDARAAIASDLADGSTEVAEVIG